MRCQRPSPPEGVVEGQRDGGEAIHAHGEVCEVNFSICQ